MADKLPLGFIDDDDKLRRNDSWRREENTGRRAGNLYQGVREQQEPCRASRGGVRRGTHWTAVQVWDPHGLGGS